MQQALCLKLLVVTAFATAALGAEGGSDTPDVIKIFLPYDPTLFPHILFMALYFLLSALFAFIIVRRRDWWAACLPLGALFEGIGFIQQYRFGDTPSMGYWISGYLFIVLAPVAYLAFNYVVFGRLVRNALQDTRVVKHTKRPGGLPPRAFKHVFVWSDILTLLAQLAGGLMHIVQGVAEIGQRVMLIGIIVQFLSISTFSLLLLRFFRKTSISDAPLRKGVRTLLLLLVVSSALILIRTVYRIVDFASGLDGGVAKSEAVFFMLDAAPVWFAIAIYLVWWPSRLVDLRRQPVDKEYALGGEVIEYGTSLQKPPFNFH